MANNTDNPQDGKPTPPKSAAGSKSTIPAVDSKPKTLDTPKPGQRPLTRNVPVASTQQMSRRMAARYQSDLKRQRQLILAAIVIVALVVLVFAIGIYQTVIGPNIKTLASFGGVNVSSGDYYTYRKIQLYQQSIQLSNIESSQQGDQKTQIDQQIQTINTELSNVQGFPVDQPTLEQLVSNQILEREAKNQFGITVSDDELNTGLANDFALYTPTALPDQAKATQTGNVFATASNKEGTVTANASTPLPTDTPAKPVLPPDVAARGTAVALTKTAGGVVTDTVASGTGTPVVSANSAGTPAISVTANISPNASDTGTPSTAETPTSVVQATASGNISPTVAASATISGTPTVAATPTVAPTETPIAADKAQATSIARRDGTLAQIKTATGVSQDDYKKFVVKPQLLQQKVTTKLISQLPLPGQNYNNLQIHVAHILLSDEQTAKDVEAKLQAASDKNAAFTDLARQYDATTDKTAASHNGDLGWAIKGLFVDDFWNAASKLNVGQISDPVHTQFGWHIIKMLDKKDNGPMELDVYNQLTDPSKSQNQDGSPKIYSDWIKQQVTAAKVSYNTPPTPTASPSPLPAPSFTAVVPPTATAPATAPAIPISTPIPGASAVAVSPVAATAGTVGATTTSAATTAGAATGAAATAATIDTSATTVAALTSVAVTPAVTASVVANTTSAATPTK